MTRPAGTAQRIAELVTETWYARQGSGRPEIPLSIAAALALAGKYDDTGRRHRWWLTATDEDVIGELKTVWACFWMLRPDLACHTGPLTHWLLENDRLDPVTVRGAAATARAVIRGGLPQLTADNGARLHGTDLLGAIYLAAKPTRARQARGEFYTPAHTCELIAQMALGPADDGPGAVFTDPCAGTGGMARTRAEALRDQGIDPADREWHMNDVGPLSVACLAVNVCLWELGRRVIIGCSDILADPGYAARAIARQAGHIRSMAGDLRSLRGLRAVRDAEAILAAGPPE